MLQCSIRDTRLINSDRSDASWQPLRRSIACVYSYKTRFLPPRKQMQERFALATQSGLSRESQSRLEAHWMLVRTFYGRVSDDAAAPGEAALLLDTAGEMPCSFEDAGPATR